MYKEYVNYRYNQSENKYFRDYWLWDNPEFSGVAISRGLEEISKEDYETWLFANKEPKDIKAQLNKKDFLASLAIDQQRVLSKIINKPENKTLIDWYFEDGSISLVEKDSIFEILDIELSLDDSISDLVTTVKERLDSLNYG